MDDLKCLIFLPLLPTCCHFKPVPPSLALCDAYRNLSLYLSIAWAPFSVLKYVSSVLQVQLFGGNWTLALLSCLSGYLLLTLKTWTLAIWQCYDGACDVAKWQHNPQIVTMTFTSQSWSNLRGGGCLDYNDRQENLSWFWKKSEVYTSEIPGQGCTFINKENEISDWDLRIKISSEGKIININILLHVTETKKFINYIDKK